MYYTDSYIFAFEKKIFIFQYIMYIHFILNREQIKR